MDGDTKITTAAAAAEEEQIDPEAPLMQQQQRPKGKRGNQKVVSEIPLSLSDLFSCVVPVVALGNQVWENWQNKEGGGDLRRRGGAGGSVVFRRRGQSDIQWREKTFIRRKSNRMSSVITCMSLLGVSFAATNKADVLFFGRNESYTFAYALFPLTALLFMALNLHVGP